MNAQELRLGNLVWNDVQKIPVAVDMKILNEQYYFDKGAPNYHSWEPIPLTYDWLVKAGFELRRKSVSLNVGGELFEYAEITVKDLGEYSKRNFIIWHKKNTGWTIDGVVRNIELSHFIQNVHQLQNLYFALTGQEIEFKEL